MRPLGGQNLIGWTASGPTSATAVAGGAKRFASSMVPPRSASTRRSPRSSCAGEAASPGVCANRAATRRARHNRRMQERSVGVVGVGNMGLAMALRLRELGAEVHVRDIDPAREALAVDAGAQRAATPAELARRADAVIVVVVDAAQTE